ncbi:hypothetical protein CAPTEDRAFT_189399 [Capitella teleta]|uniref:Uncharacterized protein n=1 Tax=Capitella teleta TaxID=283909 RepID=R7UGU3_CAPTE|nr:hypothetical protein CAPTEDRAFT_189399 [Capitella teleta]|eukprot:ELU05764.1 hypothetical protein CAPTEDRAFT_189399 [Capitella teleta]
MDASHADIARLLNSTENDRLKGLDMLLLYNEKDGDDGDHATASLSDPDSPPPSDDEDEVTTQRACAIGIDEHRESYHLRTRTKSGETQTGTELMEDLPEIYDICTEPECPGSQAEMNKVLHLKSEVCKCCRKRHLKRKHHQREIGNLKYRNAKKTSMGRHINSTRIMSSLKARRRLDDTESELAEAVATMEQATTDFEEAVATMCTDPEPEPQAADFESIKPETCQWYWVSTSKETFNTEFEVVYDEDKDETWHFPLLKDLRNGDMIVI